ncbi:hypothetical protein DI09_118p90 [Mitosporidium daphniae]|uniref:Uncharacterized protein n=1 Tax=Mitosporidium daphniae TaxID=1485682 RepID=A0A098VVX5_9MICR|nr:uncharacterized protein DI09_118p90 [Mitosporidium daphniae]KGG53014.1 hypothetical protein DI09_118p90 [Mitosporidium daphniae]|eukprot:XP_013239450.1 uncharacterized protein DI09_118p90 [Mitosporidium daphniae]
MYAETEGEEGVDAVENETAYLCKSARSYGSGFEVSMVSWHSISLSKDLSPNRVNSKQDTIIGRANLGEEHRAIMCEEYALCMLFGHCALKKPEQDGAAVIMEDKWGMGLALASAFVGDKGACVFVAFMGSGEEKYSPEKYRWITGARLK